MIWKTDWTAADNHARAGVADLNRILQNYNDLKAMLNSEYGFNISFSVPATDEYRTMPFADVLSSVENALDALHVWTIEWKEKIVIWQAGNTGPTYEDINRWEQNGLAIEEVAVALLNYHAWLVAKTFYAGHNRTVQRFSRGRFYGS